MPRCKFILLLFTIAPFFGLAQKDSLWARIRTMPDDTNKVYAFLDLGMEYEMAHPDSAIVVYEMARDLSNRIHYPMGYCKYANAVAYPLELKGLLDQKDSILRVAIAICEKEGYRRELSRKYHSLGISEQMRRDYEKALDWYLKGLTITEELRDTSMLTAYYNNLGSIYKGLSENEKAYEYIEKALVIHRARHKKSGIATALINLGILDLRFKNYDKALARNNEALVISEELQDLEGIIICHINTSDVYLGMGQYDQASYHIDKADSVSKTLDSPRYRLLCLQGKGSVLKHLGKFKESNAVLFQAEQLAIEQEESERLSAIYFDQSDNFERLGDPTNALRTYKLYHAYADSVAGENVRKNIQELELKYETSKKEKEILEKDLELERQRSDARMRTTLLILAVMIIITIGLVYWQRQRLNKQKLINLEKATQLEMLTNRERDRSRIAADMHDDLGSGLTSIRLLSEIALRKSPDGPEKQELERISTKTNELVQKMSEIIWAMNPANDELNDLIIYVRGYAAQYLDDAGIKLRFDNQTNAWNQPVTGDFRRQVFLVIKEALNNTVKYSGATETHIQFEMHEIQLTVRIADNGKGIDPNAKKGMGLSTMQQRAQQLGGSIEIKNDHGVTIQFVVPL